MTAGSDTVAAAVVDRPTVAISMGTAQNAYQGLVVIRESNGSVSQVADEQILAAQKLLAESEGIFGETASVTGLAALIEQLEDGRVEREAEIVLILTSTGLKTLAVTADLEAKAPLVENVKEFVAILRSEYSLHLDA
jgi:threonine synthase